MLSPEACTRTSGRKRDRQRGDEEEHMPDTSMYLAHPVVRCCMPSQSNTTQSTTSCDVRISPLLASPWNLSNIKWPPLDEVTQLHETPSMDANVVVSEGVAFAVDKTYKRRSRGVLIETEARGGHCTTKHLWLFSLNA